MQIKKVTKDKATVWISSDELRFMIAATERALKEIDPEYFYTRTGRTVAYANAVVAQLRVADNNGEGLMPSHQPDDHARGVADDPHARSSQRVIMTVDLVAEGGALVSLSDHELRFLNNAINEAVNGLRESKEFEATGKTGDYSDRLMDQLMAANDKIEALN
jgi:hypothetical protein